MLVAGWIVCGIIEHGLMYAFYQREFPLLAEQTRLNDFWFTFCIGSLGPLGLAAALIFLIKEGALPKHGFMLYRRAGK